MKITRKKIIITEIIFCALFIIAGITYSIYTSSSSLTSTEIEIAQFIFNANKTDSIELPIGNIVPGETIEYTFDVTNNLDSDISEVTVEYQIILKTLHNIPLRYELRYIGDIEELILTCDETTSRNDENILECKSPVRKLDYGIANNDNFKLSVIFPAIHNDSIYSGLIDYLDIDIISWQKTT